MLSELIQRSMVKCKYMSVNISRQTVNYVDASGVLHILRKLKQLNVEMALFHTHYKVWKMYLLFININLLDTLPFTFLLTIFN